MVEPLLAVGVMIKVELNHKEEMHLKEGLNQLLLEKHIQFLLETLDSKQMKTALESFSQRLEMLLVLELPSMKMVTLKDFAMLILIHLMQLKLLLDMPVSNWMVEKLE